MASILDYADAFPLWVPTGAVASVDAFCDWATSDEFPEGFRISLIDHKLVIDMSPEEFETHNKVKTEFSAVISRLARELDCGEYCSDGMLLSNEAAGLSTEPDGMFVSWDAFSSSRVQRLPRKKTVDQTTQFRGSPDMVLEVVSRSSRTKDHKVLLNSYHHAEVSEYWLVDALGDEIDFQIFRFHPDRYVPVESSDGWRHSRVFEREFLLRRTRNRIGGWQYFLEVRPATPSS